MIYCDTSMLIAALTNEAESDGVQSWMSAKASGVLCISDWVVTEFSSALAFKVRHGDVPADRRSDIIASWKEAQARQLLLLPVPQPAFAMAARFCEMRGAQLRAGDALHLAIATLGGHELATLDARMRAGAEAVGLKVNSITQ